MCRMLCPDLPSRPWLRALAAMRAHEDSAPVQDSAMRLLGNWAGGAGEALLAPVQPHPGTYTPREPRQKGAMEGWGNAIRGSHA